MTNRQNTSHAVMSQRHEPKDSLDEIWKAVSGWPGYEVSNKGNVRSWKQRSDVKGAWVIDFSRPPRGLKPCKRNGYHSVLFICGGKGRKWFSIHRLVLETFVGPPTEGYQAAHRNGDKDCNFLENLRWASPKENNGDKIIHGTLLWGQRIGTSKLTLCQVKTIIDNRERGARVKDLSEEYGVCANTITNICNGHSWKRLERDSDYE